MNKPNITEGKWEYTITRRTKNKLDTLISKKDSDEGFDWIGWVYERNNKDKANAQAISAVPEMLDALIAVKKELESIKTEDYGYHLNKVNEALKKAGVQL